MSDAPHIDRDAITTPEELTMAAEAYQRGYVAVKEEGRQEGLQEGARNKEVDMLCELLLPAVGREFGDELRTLLGNDELLVRLDPNTVFDLRLRYGTNPAEPSGPGLTFDPAAVAKSRHFEPTILSYKEVSGTAPPLPGMV